jgi:hypothetical protein
MEDSRWNVVAEDFFHGGKHAAVVLNNLDATESYKIVTRI